MMNDARVAERDNGLVETSNRVIARLVDAQEVAEAVGVLNDDTRAMFSGAIHNLSLARNAGAVDVPALLRAAYCLGKLNLAFGSMRPRDQVKRRRIRTVANAAYASVVDLQHIDEVRTPAGIWDAQNA